MFLGWLPLYLAGYLMTRTATGRQFGPRLLSMSLPALDTVTGCLLIGTWVSSLLYMFEIVQSLYYFRHFKQDDWKLKTLVTVALLVDTLSIVGDYICVFLYTITHAAYWMLAGDLVYLDNIHWPIPIYGFTTGVLAVLVQAFLVVRYWRFTQNTPIALSLSFAIIISFGSVFTCSLMLTLYPSFGDRHKFKIPAALWLVTEAAVDAGIASALLWEFRKASAILTETRILRDTRSVLDRLTAITIQSGAAAATLAGTALISYYIKPESNVYMGFLYPLGRVYVITLVCFFLPYPDRFETLLTISQLSNLNIRKSGKSFSTTDTCNVHRTIHTSVQVISVKSPQDGPPVTFKSCCQGRIGLESSGSGRVGQALGLGPGLDQTPTLSRVTEGVDGAELWSVSRITAVVDEYVGMSR
ncbi:hypothetical protein B0H19DRAFT_1240635 [Mycena capillaripes]|nr:hypothetical protein B0H19DRAFT_1240635 [Mycena capillaripes]